MASTKVSENYWHLYPLKVTTVEKWISLSIKWDGAKRQKGSLEHHSVKEIESAWSYCAVERLVKNALSWIEN